MLLFVVTFSRCFERVIGCDMNIGFEGNIGRDVTSVLNVHESWLVSHNLVEATDKLVKDNADWLNRCTLF